LRLKFGDRIAALSQAIKDLNTISSIKYYQRIYKDVYKQFFRHTEAILETIEEDHQN